MDKTLLSVECVRIEKRGYRPHRQDVYVVIVEWTSGEKYPIYRKYSSFFDFERSMRERFGSHADIPILPTRNVIEKAFKIQKNHINDINGFCQSILKLPSELAHSHTVSAFFDIWDTDFTLEENSDDRLKKKDNAKKKCSDGKNIKLGNSFDLPDGPSENAKMSCNGNSSELSHPNHDGHSQCRTSCQDDDMLLYICTCDYKSDSKDELSLVEGKKYIVVERNDDGWWFVATEDNRQQGYAPGAFLSPELPKRQYGLKEGFNTDSHVMTKHSMTVKALSSYTASKNDEMSCKEGDILEVLNTNHTGWWTVKCNGKVGLVPAVNLQLDPTSVRQSKVILRNNSLYTKKPPPRVQGFTRQGVDESGYASIDQLREEVVNFPCKTETGDNLSQLIGDSTSIPDEMATRKVPPANNKTKSEGTINYAQLVFDEENDNKPKIIKPACVKQTKSDPNSIIYTQIIPKNLRKTDDVEEEAVKKSGDQSPNTGKKTEKGKIFKKGPFSKLDESDRRTPSPPPVTGRESPVPIKPRAQPAAPQQPQQQPQQQHGHTYENHAVVPSIATNPATNHTYINLTSFQSGDTANQDPDYLRRSSIEPPPAPTVDAPKPSHTLKSGQEDDNLVPMVSQVQAIASYDGPMISGMLMFTKGDTATLMNRASGIGWWYVNLKGLEGYVPGAYWEAFSSKPSSPPSRRKAPQPMPRSRSPPTTSSNPPILPSDRNGIEHEQWYHGKMARPESEKLLSACSNGVFIIRESVNRVGDLTLSVKWESKIRHFPIIAKEGGLFYIGKHDFKTLQGVISHYSKHALFYSENNEAVKLKEPAPKTAT